MEDKLQYSVRAMNAFLLNIINTRVPNNTGFPKFFSDHMIDPMKKLVVCIYLIFSLSSFSTSWEEEFANWMRKRCGFTYGDNICPPDPKCWERNLKKCQIRKTTVYIV